MTSSELAARAWQSLKDRCCTNPKTAARIVQLSEADFRAVMIPLFEEIRHELTPPLPPGYLKTRDYLIS